MATAYFDRNSPRVVAIGRPLATSNIPTNMHIRNAMAPATAASAIRAIIPYPFAASDSAAAATSEAYVYAASASLRLAMAFS